MNSFCGILMCKDATYRPNYYLHDSSYDDEMNGNITS